MKVIELLNEKDKGGNWADVAKDHGFQIAREKQTVLGNRGTVIMLSKLEMIGENEIELQYILNPETSSWVFNAGLPGATKISFHSGEDISSLIKHIKKKKKITPHQAAEYFLSEK